MAAAGHGAPSLLERFVEAFSRVVKGRKEAEEQPGRDGEPQGEGEHPKVQADALGARQGGGVQGDELARSPVGKEETQGTAQEREEDALGQQLADEAPAAGAQGGADRDLPTAGGQPDEEEVGDVQAGDQEDRGNHPEEDHEGGADLLDEHLLEWQDLDPPTRVVRVLLLQAGGDTAHLGLRGADRDPRAQPRHAGQGVRAAVRRGRQDGRQGNPELTLLGKVEAGRRHPDDGIALVVQEKTLADGLRIGSEAALPEAVREENHVTVGRGVLVWPKFTSQKRTDANEREEVGRYPSYVEHLGLATAGEVGAPHHHGREPLEAPALPVKIVEIRDRESEAREAGLRIAG